MNLQQRSRKLGSSRSGRSISGVDEEETEDDGFLEALKGEAYAVWEEE